LHEQGTICNHRSRKTRDHPCLGNIAVTGRREMPTTLLLTLFALLLALIIAIPAGIFTAVKRYSVYDHLATVAVLLGQSMPVFWTGIMLICCLPSV